jgi:hypothetical protein
VKVLSNTTKSEQISVDSPSPSVVIRSVAWDSGWRATVSVNGEAPRAASVKRFELVQRVHIPAGHDVVTFRDRPPRLTVASVLSIGAVAILLALLGGWLLVRRRRHPITARTVPASELEPEAITV